jgi:hypothetical protein
MNSNKHVLLTALRGLKPEYGGTLVDIQETDDARIVVLFHDIPWNPSARWALALLLGRLLKTGLISLVGTEAASGGEVDLTFLRNNVNADGGLAILDHLLLDLKLAPAEHAVATAISSGRTVWLFGAEDKALYDESSRLWAKALPVVQYVRETKSASIPSRFSDSYEAFLQFNEKTKERASLMADGLLAEMEQRGVEQSVIVCSGNLPEHMSPVFRKHGVTFAVVEPIAAGIDNMDTYKKNFDNQVRWLNARADGTSGATR